MTRIALFVILVAATPATAQSDCKTNYEKFVALKTGMHLNEVTSIMGCPGIEVSITEIAGSKNEVYQWSAEGGFANATVSFINGKMISKVQIGLK